MLATKLRSFEEAFDLLNARFFENALSKSVITIYPTPGAYGHFTPWKSWEGAGGAGYCEINLGAATVNRPVIESIATLVHEMTHPRLGEIHAHHRGGRALLPHRGEQAAQARR